MLRQIAVATCAAAASIAAYPQVSVSALGQPSFSQSIEVPPGIAGMTPQLSLVYSGGGVNGPLGHGWGLQGISSITRCAAEEAIDGASNPVAYVPADKLCLDGQRLIRTDGNGNPLLSTIDASGLTGSNTIEFRTGVDSFTRIRAYGTSGSSTANGPLYLKAWTKAGQIYEYGPAPGAENHQAAVLAQGKSAVMVWAVSRISDPLGNYMDFTYTQRTRAFGSGPTLGSPVAGVEWNISSIRYTGNKTAAGSDTPPYNKIVFYYVDRTDGAGVPRDRGEAYHAGSKNVSESLLQRISSFVGTTLPNRTLVRTMELSYDKSPVTGRSRMVQLRECFGQAENAVDQPGSKCTPPTKFTYANTGDSDIVLNTEFNLNKTRLISSDGKYGVMVADFNGDGRTDLFRWSSVYKSPEVANHGLYYSNGNGTFRSESALDLPDLLFTEDGCFHSTVSDMNADGLPDIVRFSGAKKLDGSNCTFVGNNLMTVFTNLGGGKFSSRIVQAQMLQQNIRSNLILERLTSTNTSDEYCNSGGIDSISPVREAKGFSVNGRSCDYGSRFGYGWTAGSTFYLLDINGDGRTDIITSKVDALLASDPNDDIPVPTTCSACSRVYIANADGLMVEQNSNILNTTLYSDPGIASDMQSQSRLVDLDGDGLVDLTSVGRSTRGGRGSTGSWRSDGNGNFTLHGGSNYCERSLDFNGDGRGDCLYAGAGYPLSNGLYVGVGHVPNGSSTVKTANFNINGENDNLLAPEDAPVGSKYGHFMVDWNSDGRTDIFRWHDVASSNRLYVSNGDGTFTLDTPNGYTVTRFKSGDGAYDVVQGDFTGNGTMDLLRLSDGAPNAGDTDYSVTNNLYSRVSADIPDRLLTSTSPTGLISRVNYGYLVSGAGQYVSDRNTTDSADYPMIDLAPGGPVVKSIVVDSGVGTSTVTTEYAYRGLKASVDGSGSFGFRAMRTQVLAPNATSYLTTSTAYHLKRPYAGLAMNTETRLATLSTYDSATTLSRTANRYCDKTSSVLPENATEAIPCPTSAKVARPYLYKSVETGFDLAGSALPKVTTENTFNSFGDPTEIILTTVGEFDGVSRTFVKTTTNVYATPMTNFDSWILGRLISATVNNRVPPLELTPNAGTAPNAKKTTGVGLQ